jgi:hypothetical protein
MIMSDETEPKPKASLLTQWLMQSAAARVEERDRDKRAAVAKRALVEGPIAWAAFQSTAGTCTIEEAVAATRAAFAEVSTEDVTTEGYLRLVQRACDLLQDQD